MNFFKAWMAITLCFGFQNQAKTQSIVTMTLSIQSQGLRTTIYKVDDLQEAKKWYAKAFGTAPYFDQEFYVGFDIGGYELGLLLEKTDKPKTTNILTYWAVGDITDAYDTMITRGAKELETPTDVGDGIKVALVKDPWENVVGLIHNPHFKDDGKPKRAVVELVPFTLRNEVTESQLLSVSERLQAEFLMRQPGFIKRELLRKSETEWIDLVYWVNRELAEKAIQNALSSSICQEYFNLILYGEDADTGVVHFEMVSDY